MAPDLFVAEGDSTSRTAWNVAVEGQPPRFVLEIVTGASWLRDTTEKPVLYERLGVEEYAIFAPRREDGGAKLFGYHRGGCGRWEDWPREGDGLRSRALGGLLLQIDEADERFLRLSDAQGRRLLSDEEAVEEERERAREERRRAREARAREQEAQRQAAEERRRAEGEAQRAAEAEARVAALEAELARLRAEHPGA